MRDKELIRFVRQFRKGILGNQSANDMCYAICAPLQTILSIMGLETTLITVEFETTNHVFLMLQDGRIIDPTADQFSTWNLPTVYLGPIPQCYKTAMTKFDEGY